jgi:hypothetical protein
LKRPSYGSRRVCFGTEEQIRPAVVGFDEAKPSGAIDHDDAAEIHHLNSRERPADAQRVGADEP